MRVNIRDIKTNHFTINDQFQKSLIQFVDSGLVADSDFSIHLNGNSFGENFLIRIKFHGKIKSICDRCLELFSMNIEDRSTLLLSKDPKIIEHEHNDIDEVILINDDDIEIDITNHINQSINLAVPMKHVHSDGNRCNKFGQEKSDTKSLRENEELKKLKQILSNK